MTFNHTTAKEVANGGFSQKVPSPSNPGSNVAASFHSALHAVSIPVVFGTAAYTATLPKGAVIRSVSLLPTTAFTGGTSPTFKVGSAAAGADILAATTTAAPIAAAPVSPVIASGGQTVNVTIAGAPTAGAGFVVVEYFNTL